MIRRLTVLAVAVAVSGVGCGGSSGKNSSDAIEGMQAGATYAARWAVKSAVREELKVAKGLVWLEKFRAEAGEQNEKAAETSFGCTFTGSGTSASPFTGTCTSTAAMTFSCTEGSDSITYTVASGATMTITFSTDTGNFQTATSITTRMTFTAVITGGDLSATTVACTMGFTMSLTDASSDPTIDCSNTSFQCTVGTETVTCDDIQSGMIADRACG